MPTYRNDGKDTYSIVSTSKCIVYVKPGDTVETYDILSAPMTRISDSPYFPLAIRNETVTVSGTASVTGLLSCKVIRLFTEDADIILRVDSAASTYPMFLFPDQIQDISNRGEINTLHFAGNGSVKLIGLSD